MRTSNQGVNGSQIQPGDASTGENQQAEQRRSGEAGGNHPATPGGGHDSGRTYQHGKDREVGEEGVEVESDPQAAR